MYGSVPFGQTPYLSGYQISSSSGGVDNTTAIFTGTVVTSISFSAIPNEVLTSSENVTAVIVPTVSAQMSFVGQFTETDFVNAVFEARSLSGILFTASFSESSFADNVTSVFNSVCKAHIDFLAQPSESLVGGENVTAQGSLSAYVALSLKGTVQEIVDTGWGPPTSLFLEPDGIVAIALTFDQQGRPIVFYQTVNDDLRVYWYNATISANEIKSLGTGITPMAAFDYLLNVNYQESDAWVVYARGNSVYSRLQRESWNIEHLVKTFPTPVYVRKVGLTDGFVFQIEVDSEGVCSILEAIIDEVDAASVSFALTNLTFVETFTPVEDNPIPNPDPEIPDEDVDTPTPVGPQGYLIDKYKSGAWIYGAPLLDEEAGFKTSIKIKKAYTSRGETWLTATGGYLTKSPTNQYLQMTFSLREKNGALVVGFRDKEKTTPIVWPSLVIEKSKVEVEIRKNFMCTVRVYPELANGLGYGAPLVFAFADPFTSDASPAFKTDPYEKTCVGGVPMYAFQANTQCFTILTDFVIEYENFAGAWINKFEATLRQWNVQYQDGFYAVNYNPSYWQNITEA